MKKILIGFGVLCAAFVSIMYFMINDKEDQKKSDQTANARAARWAKKESVKQEPEIEQQDEKEI
jgi:hypothetical protein